MRQNHRQRHNRMPAHRWIRLWGVALMTASVLLGDLSSTAWVQLTLGDILVIDKDAGTDLLGALFRVNPANGDRELRSAFGTDPQVLRGSTPTGVAVVIDDSEPPPSVSSSSSIG